MNVKAPSRWYCLRRNLTIFYTNYAHNIYSRAFHSSSDIFFNVKTLRNAGENMSRCGAYKIEYWQEKATILQTVTLDQFVYYCISWFIPEFYIICIVMELSYDIFIDKTAWTSQKATRFPTSRIRVLYSQIGNIFTTRDLIQYKDVILLVKEIPLWR